MCLSLLMGSKRTAGHVCLFVCFLVRFFLQGGQQCWALWAFLAACPCTLFIDVISLFVDWANKDACMLAWTVWPFVSCQKTLFSHTTQMPYSPAVRLEPISSDWFSKPPLATAKAALCVGAVHLFVCLFVCCQNVCTKRDFLQK